MVVDFVIFQWVTKKMPLLEASELGYFGLEKARKIVKNRDKLGYLG